MDFDFVEIAILGKAQVNLALLSLNRDIGCVTPQYVYRMWGGTVALEDIDAGLKEIKNGCR